MKKGPFSSSLHSNQDVLAKFNGKCFVPVLLFQKYSLNKKIIFSDSSTSVQVKS